MLEINSNFQCKGSRRRREDQGEVERCARRSFPFVGSGGREFANALHRFFTCLNLIPCADEYFFPQG